jgi:hypothetical protein
MDDLTQRAEDAAAELLQAQRLTTTITQASKLLYELSGALEEAREEAETWKARYMDACGEIDRAAEALRRR